MMGADRASHMARRELVDGVFVATSIPSRLHGSHSVYANYGCRCTPCREANARHAALMRHNRLLRRVMRNGSWFAPDASRHGYYPTYVNWGCRCDPCRDANADRMRKRRGWS